jgi:hypothetical protein
MTLELGRIMTCRLPAFSALLMLLSASCRTDVRTMFAVLRGDSQVGNFEMRYLPETENMNVSPHMASRAWRVPSWRFLSRKVLRLGAEGEARIREAS